MRGTYYAILHQNPKIRICRFAPLIKGAQPTEKSVATQEPIPLNGLDYTLYFVPTVAADADGQIILHLSWDDGGERRRPKITILQEGRNLVSSSFVCYFLCLHVIKNTAVQTLFWLTDEAATAIRESLNSTNESVRQKTSTYIVDKLNNIEIGRTDIVEAVRVDAPYSDGWQPMGDTFHKGEYEKKLKALGVEEQDYQSRLK